VQDGCKGTRHREDTENVNVVPLMVGPVMLRQAPGNLVIQSQYGKFVGPPLSYPALTAVALQIRKMER
jgi:hypothetical protein